MSEVADSVDDECGQYETPKGSKRRAVSPCTSDEDSDSENDADWHPDDDRSELSDGDTDAKSVAAKATAAAAAAAPPKEKKASKVITAEESAAIISQSGKKARARKAPASPKKKKKAKIEPEGCMVCKTVYDSYTILPSYGLFRSACISCACEAMLKLTCDTCNKVKLAPSLHAQTGACAAHGQYAMRCTACTKTNPVPFQFVCTACPKTAVDSKHKPTPKDEKTPLAKKVLTCNVAGCTRTGSSRYPLTECAECHEYICATHKLVCEVQAKGDGLCSKRVCVGCASKCASCDTPVCESCSHECEGRGCQDIVCEPCIFGEYEARGEPIPLELEEYVCESCRPEAPTTPKALAPNPWVATFPSPCAYCNTVCKEPKEAFQCDGPNDCKSSICLRCHFSLSDKHAQTPVCCVNCNLS